MFLVNYLVHKNSKISVAKEGQSFSTDAHTVLLLTGTGQCGISDIRPHMRAMSVFQVTSVGT